MTEPEHGFAGYTNDREPTAACHCGATRERATQAKARAAIEIHVLHASLEAGRQRGREHESGAG